MDKTGQREIIRQLTENTSDIISVGAEAPAETLTAMADRQKTLTDALNRSLAQTTSVSPAEVAGLRDLVETAIETVKTEIGVNRGSMQATGMKKKVLSAYGDVTVSDTPPR
jgi:hypothetical protein